jgi:hypothetical protein
MSILPDAAAARVLVASYRYTDENGVLLAVKQRWEPGYDGRSKTFTWEKPDAPNSVLRYKQVADWLKYYRHWDRMLYVGGGTLPDLLAGLRKGNRLLWVVEGEKCAEALARRGALVCSGHNGAAGLTRQQARVIAGARRVRIVVDNDELNDPNNHAGMGGAAKTHDSLERVGIPADHIEFVRAAEGKDAADHLAAGFGLNEFVPLTKRQVKGLAKLVTKEQRKRYNS